MNNTERIFEMLLNNEESLAGNEYDEIYISEYDTVIDVIKSGIDAYFAKDIYDYDEENPDQPIGTDEEKAEALAQYFEQLAKDLRNDYEI